jgi:hypothetical protein
MLKEKDCERRNSKSICNRDALQTIVTTNLIQNSQFRSAPSQFQRNHTDHRHVIQQNRSRYKNVNGCKELAAFRVRDNITISNFTQETTDKVSGTVKPSTLCQNLANLPVVRRTVVKYQPVVESIKIRSEVHRRTVNGVLWSWIKTYCQQKRSLR